MDARDDYGLTRRALVVGGVGSVVALGIGVEAGARIGADGDERLVVGRFVSASGTRAANVSLRGEQVAVALDQDAVLMQGIYGRVDSVAPFVPDERIVVRGRRWGDEIHASEFESLYAEEVGTVSIDRERLSLLTLDGTHVRIPARLARQEAPNGLRTGSTYSATVWRHPGTGVVTALALNAT